MGHAYAITLWNYVKLRSVPLKSRVAMFANFVVILSWRHFHLSFLADIVAKTHPSISNGDRGRMGSRSRRWSCLVTWFWYHLIAKPCNKTGAPSWPDPYAIYAWLSSKHEIWLLYICYWVGRDLYIVLSRTVTIRVFPGNARGKLSIGTFIGVREPKFR